LALIFDLICLVSTRSIVSEIQNKVGEHR